MFASIASPGVIYQVTHSIRQYAFDRAVTTYEMNAGRDAVVAGRRIPPPDRQKTFRASSLIINHQNH
ncbi:MAG: hypothetical protein ACI9PP_000491 [Halobacteriales archaeon]